MEQISEERLAHVHPELAAKVRAAAEALAKHGTFFRVAQGLRTYEEQNRLYQQGRNGNPGHIVTNAPGGYSNHNFGCAVDCFPFLAGSSGELNWNAGTAQFQAMVAALKAQGLAWGGDWKSIHDAPHFQLANVPVSPTVNDRTLFAANGLQAVWEQYREPGGPNGATDV
jgi:peptidoglycan L-alanyl-D-glutamate endopeptidase CwlK